MNAEACRSNAFVVAFHYYIIHMLRMKAHACMIKRTYRIHAVHQCQYKSPAKVVGDSKLFSTIHAYCGPIVLHMQSDDGSPFESPPRKSKKKLEEAAGSHFFSLQCGHTPIAAVVHLLLAGRLGPDAPATTGFIRFCPSLRSSQHAARVKHAPVTPDRHSSFLCTSRGLARSSFTA